LKVGKFHYLAKELIRKKGTSVTSCRLKGLPKRDIKGKKKLKIIKENFDSFYAEKISIYKLKQFRTLY